MSLVYSPPQFTNAGMRRKCEPAKGGKEAFYCFGPNLDSTTFSYSVF